MDGNLKRLESTDGLYPGDSVVCITPHNAMDHRITMGLTYTVLREASNMETITLNHCDSISCKKSHSGCSWYVNRFGIAIHDTANAQAFDLKILEKADINLKPDERME